MHKVVTMSVILAKLKLETLQFIICVICTVSFLRGLDVVVVFIFQGLPKAHLSQNHVFQPLVKGYPLSRSAITFRRVTVTIGKTLSRLTCWLLAFLHRTG